MANMGHPSQTNQRVPGPGQLPPPPADFLTLPVEELLVTWEKPLYRIHSGNHEPWYFGKSGDYRFDDPRNEFGVLYCGTDEVCAFGETLAHNLETKLIENSSLVERHMAQLIPDINRPLRLIDLTASNLRKFGADGRINTGDYRITQTWSRAFWQHSCHPDGIYYISRLDQQRRCVALFERCPSVTISKLGSVRQSIGDASIGQILETYGIGIKQ